MKILHVTEAFGGGVTSAINTYVSHSKQFEHFLFASVRKKDLTGEELTDIFTSVNFVNSKVQFLTKLLPYIYEVDPDVIHVHSSYAGFLVRVNPFIEASKIVYTPHAFSFLRNDSAWKLFFYKLAERILAKRTAVIAACGKEEQNIAAEFIDSKKTAELVNVCGELPSFPYRSSDGKPVIAMVGRVCEQKGFQFFAEVAQMLGDSAKFLWIGGGDDLGVKVLEDASVTVTGWISRSEVLELMNQSTIYFYTAKGDGFPISVLEASYYRIPMILRAIGPFIAEGLEVVETPKDAACKLVKFLNGDEKVIGECERTSKLVAEHHTADRLRSSLNVLYGQFMK